MNQNPTFGRDEAKPAIVVEWQSTPALWLAYRKGTCFCEDCRGKVPTGLGKTKLQAAADLEEQEATR